MGERVEGKVAVVVGAGSIGQGIGNGKAAAIVYAREGARVLAVDYNLEAAEETRDSIEEEGGDCIAFKADVSNPIECKGVIEKCIDTFRRIDILHNNVGIGEVVGIAETSEEGWERTLNVNLRSMFLLCKYTIPHMVKEGGGSIVNISSIASIRYPGFAHFAYSVSKGGVDALTREIALEYASKGVRVNAILPGFINTPRIVGKLTHVYGGKVDDMIKTRDSLCPTGRMGEPWDVAYAALFLASDEAKYITGVTLPVDGGLSLKVGTTAKASR